MSVPLARESHVTIRLPPLNAVPLPEYLVDLALTQAVFAKHCGHLNPLLDLLSFGLGVRLALALADDGSLRCFSLARV